MMGVRSRVAGGRAFAWAALALMSLLLAACGGGGGGSTSVTPTPSVTANQLLVTVENNPAYFAAYAPNVTVNLPFVTVTVCDTAGNCRSIDHVIVDTGSYGLRLLASATSGLNLPPDPASGGGQLAECAGFLGGYMWGAVSHAKVQMNGEITSLIPIQVVGSTSAQPVPSSCSQNYPGGDIGTLQGLGGNGLLGIGHQIYDSNASGQAYYTCLSGACVVMNPQPAARAMVANPVAFIGNSSDNNGIVMSMPAISTSGASVVYGTLTFGVGTQSDNDVTGATVIPTNSTGDLTVNLQYINYPGSFIDSGSNFYFAPLNGVPTDSSGNYIPSTLLNFPITLSSPTGTSSSGSLNSQMYVANYRGFDFSTYFAFNDIAASTSGLVDLGMPYFYGKRITYVLSGKPSPIGTGPLYAIQ